MPVNIMDEMNIAKQKYQSPGSEWLILDSEGVVCQSPVPGGNESVQVEDWTW